MAASAPRLLQNVRSGVLMRQIGVRHAKAREDDAFELFHGGGGGFAVVIVAKQMKKPMHREMGEMMFERFAFFGRLTRRRLIGNRDVAERLRRAECLAGARCRWK